MKKTAMQLLIEDVKRMEQGLDVEELSAYVYKRATELLETEREQIEEAVLETTKYDVLQANNLLNMIGKESIFEVKGNEGKQYYKDTYE